LGGAMRSWEFAVNLTPMQYALELDKILIGFNVKTYSVVTDANFVEGSVTLISFVFYLL
jgi:hypothetical protein